MIVSPLIGLFLSLLLWASVQAAEGCRNLAEKALLSSPDYKLSLRAGAQSSKSLEAQSGVFAGIYFELPLVDPAARKRLRQQRREKETLLAAIISYQDARRLLAFKKELLSYRRQRIERGLEDHEAFLRLKEEILKLEEKLHQLEAKLWAYGINPKEAASCRW